MGLVFGRGHPVNWPPWPSSLLERKRSSCPYQCWGYHFMGLRSHETHGWAATNGNWRKRPEGSLWVGKEKEKWHSRLYFPSADFPWIVLFPPSLSSIYKTIHFHVPLGDVVLESVLLWSSMTVESSELQPCVWLCRWNKMQRKHSVPCALISTLSEEWWIKMIFKRPNLHITKKTCQLFDSLLNLNDETPVNQSFSVWL